jgi:hypothetical protein
VIASKHDQGKSSRQEELFTNQEAQQHDNSSRSRMKKRIYLLKELQNKTLDAPSPQSPKKKKRTSPEANPHDESAQDTASSSNQVERYLYAAIPKR